MAFLPGSVTEDLCGSLHGLASEARAWLATGPNIGENGERFIRDLAGAVETLTARLDFEMAWRKATDLRLGEALGRKS